MSGHSEGCLTSKATCSEASMPRVAKPYLHRGWFVTNIGGERQKLCRESGGIAVAREALDRLKVDRCRVGRVLPPALPSREGSGHLHPLPPRLAAGPRRREADLPEGQIGR